VASAKSVHRDERNPHEDRNAGAGRTPALPPGVLDALGELAGAGKDGLPALSVDVGLGVLSEMMEAELDEVVGPKHAQNKERTAHRHGHEDGQVTLGGRRVAVRRPRARTADGEEEVPLQTYEYFADRDPLTRVVLEQMLAGVSTRRFSRTREPVGEEVTGRERSVSKPRSAATSPPAARPFTPQPTRRRSQPSPCNHHTPTATTNFHGERDNLIDRSLSNSPGD
jgi:Transposase, Mutator family